MRHVHEMYRQAHLPRASVAISIGGALLLGYSRPSVAASGAPAHPSLTATAADAPIEIDGSLRESIWRRTQAAAEFRQIEPDHGVPTEYPTEVRVVYDERGIYAGVTCLHPEGETGIRVTDLRRDFEEDSGDLFGIHLDTFGDRRTAVVFQTNPYGAKRDLQVFDATWQDLEWDAIWQVAAERSREGWSAEFFLPWSTLRRPRGVEAFGINFVRMVKRTNEVSAWSPWPRGQDPYRMDHAGVLEVVVPSESPLNMTITPYVAGRAAHYSSDISFDVGGDAKWVIGTGTTLDITVNTDFAEAEVDRQVINLRRFSVFLPERRRFFLENAGLFKMGVEDIVLPFFSRRIGLDEAGKPIPIDAGMRLVTRNRGPNAGLLLIRERGGPDSGGTWFTVGRYSHNLGEQLRLGGLAAVRHEPGASGVRPETNAVIALDGLARRGPWSFDPMITASMSSAVGTGAAGTFIAAYESEWGYIDVLEGFITRDYRAGTGFVSREDMLMSSQDTNLDLRPWWRPTFVRAFIPRVTTSVYHSLSSMELEEALLELAPVGILLGGGDQVRAGVSLEWQRLSKPFEPVPTLLLAEGEYSARRGWVELETEPSRKLAANVRGMAGEFYDGLQYQVRASARLQPSPHLMFAPAFEWNHFEGVGGANGALNAYLMASEVRVSVSPQLHLSGIYQRNTVDSFEAWNFRLAWELRPQSFLFVTYDDVYEPNPETRELNHRYQATLKLSVTWQHGSCGRK